jgi:hypothetical protein
MEKSILKVDPVAFRYDEPELEDNSDAFGEEDECDFEWDQDDLDEGDLPVDEDFDEDFDDDFDEDDFDENDEF